MTKGKVLGLILALVLILSVSLVSADFSYNERYDSYTRQYDTWIYDVDIDDEDYRIILKHVWSSPRYSYDYETGSDFAFDYAPPTPRYLSNVLNLNQPPTYSYNLGRDLTRGYGIGGYYRTYGYSGYSRNYYGGYYSSYNRNSWW